MRDPTLPPNDEAEARDPADDEAEDRARFSRRAFLQGLGASAAVASLSSCARPPAERILPYSKRPPELTPGVPLHFATASALGGYGLGLLVESHEGRPTKVEGNPDHPASLGATGTFEQLLVLQLFDPYRARGFRQGASPSSWAALQQAMLAKAALLAQDGGAKLRLLLEPNASPLLAELRARVGRAFPNARLYAYSPASSGAAAAGARLAFGRPFEPVYDLAKAAVVLCLDDDLLGGGPMALRYARAFAGRRAPGPEMNRLYVAEPAYTPTGTLADHRLRVKPSQIGVLAAGLLERLGRDGPPAKLGLTAPPAGALARWLEAVAEDLRANRGRCLVTAGGRQPPEVHAIVHAINALLGNVGQTVALHPSGLEPAPGVEGLGALVREMEGGAVDTLIVTAHNPAFTAPGDVRFAEALKKVPASVYLGYYEDETAPLCSWFVPAAHLLESWGDTRAADGTVALVQPLIAPLFAGVGEADLLAALLGQAGRGGGFGLLKDFWRGRARLGDGFEQQWEMWLADGVVPDTATAPERAEVDWAGLGRALGGWRPGEAPRSSAAGAPPPDDPSGPLEVVFAPDAKVFDGRFANLAAAQELPDPITKLTWGNAAWLSPATARRLGVQSDDVVRLALHGKTVEAPVQVVAGTADDCVVLPLGYGHTAPALRIARGVGFDASPLRTAAAPWSDRGLELARTGRRQRQALSQWHFGTEGRPVAFALTQEELRAGPQRLAAQRGPLPALYDPLAKVPQTHRWAMSIDLGRCTGCSACVLACQTENNVPVVGKAGVLNNREMHWLRVDRYFLGAGEEQETVNEPMLCQHCEYAPCEYVCPVNATVHSEEGLNEQVYNRCVGTRYCSNNCPYKVRRFNFFEYNGRKTELEKMAMNPDVTVRSRGVMEKCTYCVQRIERARISARRQGKEIGEGEVVPACAQACPTEAIVFGDLNLPEARVSALRADPRRFDVLHEVGTRPRTTYLARIKNPNPKLK